MCPVGHQQETVLVLLITEDDSGGYPAILSQYLLLGFPVFTRNADLQAQAQGSEAQLGTRQLWAEGFPPFLPWPEVLSGALTP